MRTFNTQNPLNPLAHSFLESGGELLLEDSERAQTEAGGKTKIVRVVSLGYASPPAQVGPSGNALSEKKNCMLENILLGTRTECWKAGP